MSRIDDLIKELCPDGVEFRNLGDIARLKNGKDHKPLGDGDIPVYGSGGILRHVNQHMAFGPSVLIPRKGSLGNIFFVEGPFWNVDTIFSTEIDESAIEPRFLFHLLLHLRLDEMNQAGGVPSQTQRALNRLRLPVPPLEVQREIVRILDAFTELEARKKQYEYYHHLLIDSSNDSRTLPLGTVAAYSTERVDSVLLDENNFVGVDNLLPEKRGKKAAEYAPNTATLTKFAEGDVLIGNIRPYLRKIWLASNTGGASGDVLVLRIKEAFQSELLDEYFYYLLSSENFFHFNIANSKGSKMPRGDKKAILRYNLVIPPIDHQLRTVEILNYFQTLVNDISSGLPAEIEARRKQYEYYRDKLLTFKEKAS